MADGRITKTNIPLIGILALKNQLVTKAELEAGLIQCKDSKTPEADLKSYFVSQELISNKNIQRLTLAAKAISIRRRSIISAPLPWPKALSIKVYWILPLKISRRILRIRKSPGLLGI